jgi:hypothetical protein
VTETLWRLTATGGSQTKARSRTATRGHPAQAVKATTSSSVACARNVRAYLRHSARRDGILAADRERCQSLRGGRSFGLPPGHFRQQRLSRSRRSGMGGGDGDRPKREGNEGEKVKRSSRNRTRRGGAPRLGRLLLPPLSLHREDRRWGDSDGSVCLTWWVRRCVGPSASE